MTLAEIAELLGFAAAFDRRTVGKADVLAWQTVLHDLDYEAARQAVARHYGDQTRWVMPADIRRAVSTERRDRLERHVEAEPPPGADTDRTYTAALLAERVAIADGRTQPNTLRALPPGSSTYEGRSRAILATVGRTPTSRRPEFTAPCPHCRAPAGDPCTTGRGERRREAHPSRLDASRALRNGQPTPTTSDLQAEIARRHAASAATLTQPPRAPATDPRSRQRKPVTMTTEEIIQDSASGHTHWGWQCPKESGGCGYTSPWWARTKADAEAGLAAHRENCRPGRGRDGGTR